MFGREPRLPINDKFNFPNQKESVTVNTYVERLLTKLDVASRKAKENAAIGASNRKKYCDRNVHYHTLAPGGIVLVRKNLFDSNYKIADEWEDEPHMDDTPMYSVVQMTPSNTSRILHRNMLHPACSVQFENAASGKVDPVLVHKPCITALVKANNLMYIYFSN